MGVLIVFQVVNGVVLETYINERHASTHARAVTGARVVPLEVRDRLPSAVIDDLASDEDNDDDLTPVQVPIPEGSRPRGDNVITQAATPRAIARRRKPR